MNEQIIALVNEFHTTRSIDTACTACDLLYQELQAKGEKSNEED